MESGVSYLSKSSVIGILFDKTKEWAYSNFFYLIKRGTAWLEGKSLESTSALSCYCLDISYPINLYIS